VHTWNALVDYQTQLGWQIEEAKDSSCHSKKLSEFECAVVVLVC